jgi:hypothetical protein
MTQRDYPPADDFDPKNASSSASDSMTLTDQQVEALTAVQVKHMDKLMSYPNVVGIGIGFAQDGEQQTNVPAVIVMVSEKLPMAQLAEEEVLPKELDGVRIDVQETGGFLAY